MASGGEQELLWEGRRTADQAEAALREGRDVLLQLPADYNHALFQHLHPHASAGATETIDADGGAELLEVAAQLSGLAPLGALAEAARQVDAQVKVRSPAVIAIYPSRPAAA